MHGLRPPAGRAGPAMPAFGDSFSDRQLADITAYLRARFTDKPPWPDSRAAVGAGAQGRRRMITLTVNGTSHQVDAAPDTPLLYVLRNDLGLNGAKFGCGLGPMRRLHRAGRRQARLLLPVAGRGAGRAQGADHRRARHADKPCRAAGRLRGRAGGAVRLLHRRHDHARPGAAGSATSAPTEAQLRAAHGAQSLPLRHPHAHPARGAPRGGAMGGGVRDDAEDGL